MPDHAEPKPNRRSLRPILIAAAGALALAATAVAMWRGLGPGLPLITPADLETARARWQAHELRNYDATIVLAGRQTGTLQIEVRDGEPRSLIRNGTVMKQERTWRPWTVPGMFETLETDFDNAADPEKRFGSAEVRVFMRARFDPVYGYPARYLHQVYGRHEDLTWEVTEFVKR